MSEKLICGNCGSNEIFIDEDKYRWFFNCPTLTCSVATITISKSLCPTKAEAIAAFKRATRADVKQGINWIPVKDRLPKKNGKYLVTDGKCWAEIEWQEEYEYWRNMPTCLIGEDVTHWAEINLPEK
jgi:hypothetical protein